MFYTGPQISKKFPIPIRNKKEAAIEIIVNENYSEI